MSKKHWSNSVGGRSLVDALQLDDNYVVTDTFSSTVGHKLLMKELFEQLSPEAQRKFSKSRLFRDAIELFAESFDPAKYDAELAGELDLDIRRHPGFAPIDKSLAREVRPLRSKRAGSLSGVFPR